uniref:UPF3 domain-containing protein n=1 Tax=Cebus imitator TaxID=2715852 RepID=A0A2K5PXZ6_CEBIM
MKEDKEHRPKEKRVTLLTPPGATAWMTERDSVSKKKKVYSRCYAAVLRTFSSCKTETLPIKQLISLSPAPDSHYYTFCQEYPAIVEFAPFQKAAKKKTKKRDTKVGTIDDDPEYRKFLESYATDNEKMTSTPETLLEEIEAKNRELIAKKTTPLLSFLKNKQRMREEKREERRRREIERKRQREEERRKWKEEEKRKRKDIEKLKKIDRIPERDKLKDEPKIKDRPAMQLYQPGARSRNRLCPPDDSTKSGDSAVERKQESGISHRKEGGEE